MILYVTSYIFLSGLKYFQKTLREDLKKWASGRASTDTPLPLQTWALFYCLGTFYMTFMPLKINHITGWAFKTPFDPPPHTIYKQF